MFESLSFKAIVEIDIDYSCIKKWIELRLESVKTGPNLQEILQYDVGTVP